MPVLPAFAEMTDEQKFQFFYQWCDNLTRAEKEDRNNIQLLHERLRVAEEKAGISRTS